MSSSSTSIGCSAGTGGGVTGGRTSSGTGLYSSCRGICSNVRGSAGGWSPSPAVAESRIVMPPCATSEVLPDQKVTIEIFDAGMSLCTSMKSREEVTNSW